MVAAKVKLGLDFLVLPMRAFAEDEQGWVKLSGDSRVLVLREHDSHLICDYALVRDVSNEAALIDALEWVLTDTVDTRASTVEKTLAALGLKEIPATQLRYERLSQNLRINDSGRVPIFRSEESENDTGE